MTRVAIVGLGAVTRNIHLPAYARLKDKLQIIAGCDPDGAARGMAENKWRIPAVFTEAGEMIEKTRPDVVAICTPPALHHPQTLLALDAGCHVFLEKPLAETLSQADEIIRAAERANRMVVVNTQFPCMEIYRASKAMIGAPEFGRLFFIHAWQKMRPSEQAEAGWRGEMERRVCYEFGVHLFELVRFFFDDTPAKITAHIPRPNPAIESDAVSTIALELADGRAATIVLDRLSKGPDRYLEMHLDGEFASIHTSIGGEARFEIGMETRSKRPFFGLHFVKGGKAMLQNGTRSKLIAKDGINPFASSTAYHFNCFLEALKRGETPPGAAADNRNTLALAFAAYDSAEAGRTVEMARYLEPGAAAASR
jgi:predicted dehydrogenase